MAELLIGCGRRHEKIWGGADWSRLVTLDIDPNLNPDVVWDLNTLPLPFDAETFDEIHCSEVLEHLGTQGDWRGWFRFFDEMYRLLIGGGTFNVSCPRHDSIWALGDPGHTRIVTREQFLYLQRPFYAQCGETACTDYTPYFVSDWNSTRLEHTEHQMMVQLQAVKPARDHKKYRISETGILAKVS